MISKKYTTSFFLILLLTGLLLMVGVQIGSFKTDLGTLFSVITTYDSDKAEHFAILELRIPRLLLALLTGGTLALSGYLMQAMTNNPLADPYLLGTSSGASLGANIVYAGIVPANIFTVSLFSFSGAIAVTIAAIAIAYQKGRIEPNRLLLSGVALSALMVSVSSLMMYQSNDDNRLKNIIYWTLGGFEFAGWEQLPLVALIVLVLSILFSFYQKQLNLLLLGEERAENIGVNTKALRWIVLIACSLATGIAVSIAGPIGFVGLIIPHFIRSFYGVSGRYNIIFVVLWGGIFLLACDVISRLIFYPSGVPIGIITSFVGIPFFVYLLGKNKFRF
ncbi:MAG TPA: iron ABC transporter permease [Cytophagaceae bacterium]|jgi:iron complex transport system permease protein|nr:iron ABC transporter permease [Cytophagaceae bacterium]